MKLQRFKNAVAALAAGSALAACGADGDSSEDPAVARGEMVYRNICVVCHNADPNEDGTLGPAIANSTLELLEAKVLHGEYPPGHTPARDTHQMPQFEYLAPNLADIQAFIASRSKQL